MAVAVQGASPSAEGLPQSLHQRATATGRQSLSMTAPARALQVLGGGGPREWAVTISRNLRPATPAPAAPGGAGPRAWVVMASIPAPVSQVMVGEDLQGWAAAAAELQCPPAVGPGQACGRAKQGPPCALRLRLWHQSRPCWMIRRRRSILSFRTTTATQSSDRRAAQSNGCRDTCMTQPVPLPWRRSTMSQWLTTRTAPPAKCVSHDRFFRGSVFLLHRQLPLPDTPLTHCPYTLPPKNLALTLSCSRSGYPLAPRPFLFSIPPRRASSSLVYLFMTPDDSSRGRTTLSVRDFSPVPLGMG